MTNKLATRPMSPFDEEPDIHEIQEFISGGGSLVQYCRHHQLPFGAVRKWISQDEKRKAAYDDAMGAREDFYIQTLYNMVLEIASFDPSTVEDDMGNILPLQQWPPQARAALIQVQTKDGGLTGAKFTPKLDAVKMLGQAISMFNRKPQEQEKKGLADLLAEVEEEEANESAD